VSQSTIFERSPRRLGRAGLHGLEKTLGRRTRKASALPGLLLDRDLHVAVEVRTVNARPVGWNAACNVEQEKCENVNSGEQRSGRLLGGRATQPFMTTEALSILDARHAFGLGGSGPKGGGGYSRTRIFYYPSVALFLLCTLPSFQFCTRICFLRILDILLNERSELHTYVHILCWVYVCS